MSEHVVRYTTVGGDRYLQATGLTWSEAQDVWSVLEQKRRDGRLPWVKFFEVRSAEDPSNPTVRVPTRKQRYDDPADALRLRRVKLVERQTVYTWQCVFCGKAFQGSGFGVGAHRRACKGADRHPAFVGRVS